MRPFRLVAPLSLLLIGAACSRPGDATPARESASVSAGGAVATRAAAASAPATGMTPGLTDSISVKADLGRIRGDAAAPVWLVEVSDFQCPFCKRWHDEVFATIDKEYVQTGKVRLAYLNFPLTSLHPNARGAAETAMCAAVQGKFWPLHESLFATQEKWGPMPSAAPVFDSLARAAGVDTTSWRRCVQSHATAALIDADHDRSASAGVNSTPSFFIGDRALAGAYPVDSFRVVIDAALKKARGTK